MNNATIRSSILLNDYRVIRQPNGDKRIYLGGSNYIDWTAPSHAVLGGTDAIIHRSHDGYRMLHSADVGADCMTKILMLLH